MKKMLALLVIYAATTVAVAARATPGTARILAFDLDNHEVANVAFPVPTAGAELWPTMLALAAEGKLGVRHQVFGDVVVVREINGEAHTFSTTGWILTLQSGGSRLRNQALQGAVLRPGDVAVWQLMRMSNVPPVDVEPVPLEPYEPEL